MLLRWFALSTLTSNLNGMTVTYENRTFNNVLIFIII